jgi:hypothetical protein
MVGQRLALWQEGVGGRDSSMIRVRRTRFFRLISALLMRIALVRLCCSERLAAFGALTAWSVSHGGVPMDVWDGAGG